MKIKQLLLLLSFSAFSQIIYAQSSDYKNSIDSVMSYFSKENSFLSNIEMKKGNDIIYSYSSNSLEPKDGQYRIGSITKTFTSIIIFQLIE